MHLNMITYMYLKCPNNLKKNIPMQMGGIRLVPKNWKDAQLKIHKACPTEDEAYDVFYIDSDDFNPKHTVSMHNVVKQIGFGL